MTEQEIRQQLAEFERTFAAGWDDGGCIGLKEPYSWESCARVALDLARAALGSSPPPALAVEDARAYVLARMVSAGRSENDVAKVDALIAAVQASRAAEPGTCATCRHRQADLICHYEASPIYRMATSDTQAAKLRCIFHAPQEPSR